MSIQHNLLYFHRASFGQLLQRVEEAYGVHSLEVGIKSTAKALRTERCILEVLNDCGGWDPKSLASELECDLSLAIFCLVLFCCDGQTIAVPDLFKTGGLRSAGRRLGEACGYPSESAMALVLAGWRPPATSSAAYILNAMDLCGDEHEVNDIRSNLILLDCELLHIVHG